MGGVRLSVTVSTERTEQIIRGALLCVACDLPAGRKTCGFLGHSANLGCSKCLKVFKGDITNKDYSGFNRSEWKVRSNKEHRESITKILSSKTKSEVESRYGCRYPCLLELPYFDAPRMLSIDPMHNLFLGTCKHMIAIWTNQNFISKDQNEVIQNIIDNTSVPSDVGRIPQKIASGFASFKADQFKLWATTYSIPALYNILPTDHLECWRHFVLACRILCKQTLSRSDIEIADGLLIHFCRRVEILYGKKYITPNMHLHCHLKDVFLDYGPAQEFWLFPFERYNGILGKQPSNNKAIEPQLMKRFLADTHAHSFQYPDDYKEELASVIIEKQVVGSVSDTLTPSQFKLPLKYKRGVFDSDCVAALRVLLQKMRPSLQNCEVLSIFEKFSSITLIGKVFNSVANVAN